MPGFKDIIKKEQITALERHQKALDDNLNVRLYVIGKELGDIRDAQELFYEKLLAQTWQGRFKALVEWLGRK